MKEEDGKFFFDWTFLLELVGEEHMDFIISLAEYSNDKEIKFSIHQKDFVVCRVSSYIKENIFNEDEVFHLYQFCYLINPCSRAINYRLFIYYLKKSEVIKAIPHILHLVDEFEFTPGMFYENALYLCVFYDILHFMLGTQRIISKNLSQEVSDSITKIEKLNLEYRKCLLQQLTEDELRFIHNGQIIREKELEVIELILRRAYSLAYKFSKVLDKKEYPNLRGITYLLSLYSWIVLKNVHPSTRSNRNMRYILTLIQAEKYNILKDICLLPHIESFLGTTPGKIKSLQVIIDELLSIINMRDEEFSVYAPKANDTSDSEQSVDDMILKGDFLGAYDRLGESIIESENNYNLILYCLLNRYKAAVEPLRLNPNVPSHALVLLTLKNLDCYDIGTYNRQNIERRESNGNNN